MVLKIYLIYVSMFLCQDITQCKRRSCTTASNVYCKECNEDNAIFKRYNWDKECKRMCAWNNHYCWPGNCGSDGLSQDCTCAPGFNKVSIDGASLNSGETTCQPTKNPSILTCDTVAVGPNGEKKRAMSSAASTACEHLKDMYGNFQPSVMEFDMASDLIIDVTSILKPAFIVESNFGISDSTVSINRMPVNGVLTTLSTHHQRVDLDNSKSVISNDHQDGNLTVTDGMYKLNNGEALCLNYEAKGGGYLKAKDTRGDIHTVLPAVPYTKTNSSRQVCFRYDDTPPEHCSVSRTCSSEPLQLDHRISRDPIHTVTFTGWSDPVPTGGKSLTASQIESYEIRVNEVLPSEGIHKVGYTTNVLSTKVNHTIREMTLNLSSAKPNLYCLTLEVKDVADNVRQCRRFILVDQTTFIETHPDQPFQFTSASPETGNTWQTHHNDICLSWKEYFFNKFYFNNELFNGVEAEPHGLITGNYEQISGELPVSGTPNVHGIIKYMVSWKLNDKPFSTEIEVPDFLNQTFCQLLPVNDGETYIFNVRPIDIVGNTYNDNRTVFIDQSAPHITEIWLQKDGYEQLFVHDSTDLSKMQMTFDAFDTHSGLLQIHWRFGIADTSTELISEHLSVVKHQNQSCPSSSTNCYCPKIGDCEFDNYTIPLNKLQRVNKHIGHHNRNYFFEITVTNHANLSSTEYIDVLVDESPPEKGVVYEGPEDSKDIDYTSEDSFMVHWHGFIDHESGIKLYRLGVSHRCLGKNELYNFTDIADIFVYREMPLSEQSIRVPANFTGKRYVTVIALNNAMEPSEAVCSDGITRDLSPPEIRNLTLQHGRWSESIMCSDTDVFLLESNMQKVKLHNTNSCQQLCQSVSETSTIADLLPLNPETKNDTDVSEFLCGRFHPYTNDTIVYLPNDHFYLQWDVLETGSQINDYYVGIGFDATEYDSPAIAYMSTERKPLFKMRHDGIGSNELFYIFIKVSSKAGLDNIYTLGPVLIDQTPPLSTTLPNVFVEKDQIIFGWNDTTFYDEEQTAQIDQIFFQIAHGAIAVSPYLEWRLDDSPSCPAFTGGCFKYPLRRLQLQDTDNNIPFHVNLHVYNNAGHYLSIATEPFKIPSRYPPGKSTVFDTDPEFLDMTPLADVDVHFKLSVLCASWTDATHHKTVLYEVGVGLTNVTDDIIAFQHVNDISYFCFNSSAIHTDKTYFFLLRSTCSAGSTISSSDGVIVLDKEYLRNSLDLQPGRNCFGLDYDSIALQSNSSVIWKPKPLLVGQGYVITLDVFAYEIHSDDASISRSTSGFVIIPFKSNINITIRMTTAQPPGLAFLYFCPNKDVLPFSINELIVNWMFSNPVQSSSFVYMVGVEKVKAVSNILVLPYQKATHNFEHRFKDLSSIKGTDDEYVAKVRICSITHCLEDVISNPFTMDQSDPEVQVEALSAESNNHADCLSLHARWRIVPAEFRVSFHQYTLALDKSGNRKLIPWRSVANTSLTIQLDECITIPGPRLITAFLCVRTFSLSGENIQSCREIIQTNTGNYANNMVYDFDANADTWNKIKSKSLSEPGPLATEADTQIKTLHSADLGDLYSVLHNNELNFGTAASVPAGAITYASDRQVTWYLMTSPHVPTDCDTDAACRVSLSTEGGFVVFDTQDVTPNERYFICAHSNASEVEREWYTETFDELLSCSNGFIFDTIAPLPRQVYVQNTNGFLTARQDVIVHWEEFKENVDATEFGYPSSIMEYSISCGTLPGRDDLVATRLVGHDTSAMFHITSLKDGTSAYFTVTGKDYANNERSVTSEEFVVDSSPPGTGIVLFDGLDSETNYITGSTLRLRLERFYDHHSSIDHYNVGVGSSPDMADVVPLLNYQSNLFYISLASTGVVDGHKLYVIVQAVNRAGLAGNFISKQFVRDMSPPSGGHVLDGQWDNEIDQDFQQDVSVLKGHWKGFSDLESSFAFYRVGLGDERFVTNLRQLVNVGLSTVIAWNGSFVPGKTYYVTVEACNQAGLCTTRTSDGITIDNSRPIAGRVHVGSSSRHERYLPHRSTLHIQWAGFEDPQSDIDRFEVCVGSRRMECDVVYRFNALLHSNIIKSNLTLPTNTELFATVWAFNKLGMNASDSSNAFFVDESAPIIKQKPTFNIGATSTKGSTSQWDRSLLKLDWKFVDQESPITCNKLSLLTHHDGHTPVENIFIGSEQHFTINLDGASWLNNGDRYVVVITSCNAAGLCTTDRTDDLLIDSTSPHMGGLQSHIPNTWNNSVNSTKETKSNIHLTWYGFYDQESEIDKYFITVSRTYYMQELSRGVYIVNHNTTSQTQNVHMILSESLKIDDYIIVSIWAQNNVGLNSSISKTTLLTLSNSLSSPSESGFFAIQKHSCDIHSCYKDCTCAVVGKPCVEVNDNTTCSEINRTTSDNDKIDVFGGLLHQKLTVTASSACLAGHWNMPSTVNDTVQRYEWSLGVRNHSVGEGIFDLSSEGPWNDVGLTQQFVYCLPTNKSLVHNEDYVIYVRVWYDSTSFSVFTSPQIRVDHTPPSVRRGRYIIEGQSTCSKDFDFIDWTDSISACWANVFIEQQSKIIYYSVGFGTSPNADDIISTMNTGLNEAVTFSNVTLTHATRYYFTVTAVNEVGLYTTIASDGFIVDINKPSIGVVFNSANHKDARFQSSSSEFTASWHGFQDHCSGVQNYFIALVEDEDTNATRFTNVALQTTFTFTKLSLIDGHTYRAAVKAVDAAGHESDVVVSAPVTVDTSPPSGYVCVRYLQTTPDITSASNNTFLLNLQENILYAVEGIITNTSSINIILNIENLNIPIPERVLHNGSYYFSYTFTATETKRQIVTLSISSDNFDFSNPQVFISECVEMLVNDSHAFEAIQVAPDQIAVTLFAIDLESNIQKVQVGAGTTPGSFQVQPLTDIHAPIGFILIKGDLYHGSEVYVTVITENHAGIVRAFQATTPVVVDHTPPEVDKVAVSVEVVEVNITGDLELREDVTVTWSALDETSGINYCTCVLGSFPYVDDVKSSWVSNNTDRCEATGLSLSHGMTIFVTVKCVNNIELANTVFSTPVYISLDKPQSNTAALDINPITETIQHDYFAGAASTLRIQSNQTCLQFHWDGFEDVSHIIGYGYEILDSFNKSLTDWRDAGYRTMVTKCGLLLSSGHSAVADVRAVNSGDHWSDTISNFILISSTSPRLTGNAVVTTRDGQTLRLDWGGVFNHLPDVPVAYSVVVGTLDGYTDVLDLSFTSGHTHDVIVPTETLLTPNPTNLFIKVTCTDINGLATVYATTYTL